MLTLAEMRKIRPFTDFYNDRENIFIFPTADGLATHVIKSLLFRLENLEQKSYIYIEDTKQVNKRDIDTGTYIDSDLGKKRAQVLAERFGGSFSTEVISGSVKNPESKYTGVGLNVFIVSTNGERNYMPEDVSRLVIRTGISVGVTEDSNLFLLEGFYNGDDMIIRVKIGSGGVMQGSGDRTIVRNAGISLAEQYVRNAMTGQLIFNLINTAVTDGMQFNYAGITGNAKQGALRKTYLKGRGKTSIYHRVRVVGLETISPEAVAFEDSFGEYEDIHKENITQKTNRMYGRFAGDMDAYANLMSGNLQAYRLAHAQTMDAETKEGLRRLQMISDRIREKIQAETGVQSEDYALMNTIIGYTESRIGSIWGA